ncbi:CD209 antigen-like protein C [Astyanax mexicanus]|uniref:CD209 antigen-like protein C n=1 Tax=Astyanax mexicanus TaxID=7994 RepID=UPI0020CB600E|nr:CD209 antigen-like protein C [Astyanax mexicanus]
MDHVYGNYDLELSSTDGKNRGPSSPVTDISGRKRRSFRERDSHLSPKTLKVLLVVLGFLLLCALVALCGLGVLYFNKGVSSELCVGAQQRISVQLHNATDAAKELKSHLDQVQVNYENALRRIASLNETERQCEALKVKYRQVHEVFSTCSDYKNCNQCGDGWKRLGVKCYFSSTDFLNWANSRDRCVKSGGHLVIITSQAEQTFLSTFLGGVGRLHWIGLNDLETEGKWMWVNNQPLTETGVTFWHKRKGKPDEPDNWKTEDPSGENCAIVQDLGPGDGTVWADVPCSTTTKYICEK